MKRLFLITFIVVLSVLCKAQTVDSIQAKANYGSSIDDIQLLMEIDHIDYYKVLFKQDNSIKNSCLFLTAKEYWNGRVTKTDTLLPTEYAKGNFKLAKDSSTLSLITKPLNDSVLFNYRFLGLSMSRKYKRINSDEYSLRDGLVTNEEFKKIPTNKTIPLFVYSLPYEDPKQPGYKFYCALTANGVTPEKWWDKYKVKHYIVVEMKIVTE